MRRWPRCDGRTKTTENHTQGAIPAEEEDNAMTSGINAVAEAFARNASQHLTPETRKRLLELTTGTEEALALLIADHAVMRWFCGTLDGDGLHHSSDQLRDTLNWDQAAQAARNALGMAQSDDPLDRLQDTIDTASVAIEAADWATQLQTGGGQNVEREAPQLARTAAELLDTMKEQEIGCADRAAEELAAEMLGLASGIRQSPDLRQEEGAEDVPPQILRVTLTRKERRVVENLLGRELEAPE